MRTHLPRRCMAIWILIAALILPSISRKSQASTFSWNGVSGVYALPGYWTRTAGSTSAPPVVGDTALFNKGLSYTVSFDANAASDILSFLAGSVTFDSIGGLKHYDLTSGTGAINVSGGSLTVGSFGSPLAITANSLNVQNADMSFQFGSSYSSNSLVMPAGTLRFYTGSTLTLADHIEMGSVSGASANLTFYGPGSNLVIGNPSGVNNLGMAAGSSGNLNLDSGTIAGTLNVGQSPNSTGSLGVSGPVTVATVNVGVPSMTRGSIVVDGIGAALTQNPSSILTIGSMSSGQGNLNVRNNGTLTAGAGTVLNASGEIDLGGGIADLKTLTNNGGVISFTSGSLRFLGDLPIGLNGLVRKSVALSSDSNIELSGTTTIDPQYNLTINGGRFSTGSLVNNGSFSFPSGTFAITGPVGFTFGQTGVLGSRFNLVDGQAIQVTNTTTIDNSALLLVQGGNLAATGGIANNGEIHISSLTFTSDWRHSDQWRPRAWRWPNRQRACELRGR